MARGKESIYHSFLKLLGPDRREETNSNSPGEKEGDFCQIYMKSNLFAGKPSSISSQPDLTLLLQSYTTSHTQRFLSAAQFFLKMNTFVRNYLQGVWHTLRVLRMRKCSGYVCIIWQFMMRKGIFKDSQCSLQLNNTRWMRVMFVNSVLDMKHPLSGNTGLVTLESQNKVAQPKKNRYSHQGLGSHSGDASTSVDGAAETALWSDGWTLMCVKFRAVIRGLTGSWEASCFRANWVNEWHVGGTKLQIKRQDAEVK